MRIPDAYFNGGLGQRIARPQGVVMPDTSGASAVGRAGARLGGTVSAIAEQELQEQGRQELIEAHEQKNEQERQRREAEAELKRMAKLREHSATKAEFFSLDEKLTGLTQQLVDDPDVPPENYPEEFRKRATEITGPMRQKLSEEQWLTIGPEVEHRISQGAQKMLATGQQEIQSAAFADDIRAAEAMMNNPAMTARQKIQLINDDNFFADTGKAPHEIEAIRQKYIDRAIENEVLASLNDAPTVADLEKFAAGLRKQNEAGGYTYMPEMDVKTRERYIDLAQTGIRQQKAELKRLEAENKRLRLDTARTAFDLYKDAKESGMPISIKQENGFLAQMQGTPYYEQAKQVQQRTSDFGFKLQKLKEDPLTFGAAQMGLAVPPLDPRNVAAWPQQLQARGVVAAGIRQQYGLSYLPVLTNQEATGLVGLMTEQAPRGIVQTVSGMAGVPGMKGATMNRISQQVAAADPGLGMVFGLAANGREDAAFHVANGLQLIKAKSATELKGRDSIGSALDARFDTNIKDAVSDNPRLRDTMLTATRAAYISMMAANGRSGEELDMTTYDNAFRSVVGDVAKINGKRVVLPSGMGEGTFKDMFKRISADTVKAAGGAQGFKSLDDAAAAIRGDGKLYEAGEGRYRVAIDGKFIQTDNGGDFLLSLGSHW